MYYNWKSICGWSLNRANKQSSEIVGQKERFISLSKGQPYIKADKSIAVILLQQAKPMSVSKGQLRARADKPSDILKTSQSDAAC